MMMNLCIPLIIAKHTKRMGALMEITLLISLTDCKSTVETQTQESIE